MSALAGLRVLVLDDQPPTPHIDGASVRMVGLLEALRDLGCEVCFGYTGAERGWAIEPPCQHLLAGDAEVAAWLRTEGSGIETAILSRPHLAADWIGPVRRYAHSAFVAYDAVDLYFLREFRHAKITGSVGLLRGALERRRQEIALARAADCVFVVSGDERELLQRECPGACVRVVSNVHALEPLSEVLGDRDGFLFVGNFRHRPNSDAVSYLLAEVWPLLRSRDPAARLTVAGAGAPEPTKPAPGVTVAGHVPDLTPLLGAARAMVAPLRFGAGVKGKVLLAMAHGLPVVGTPLALEGIGDGSEALVAEEAAGLVDAMLRLSRDESLWHELRESGLGLVERDFSPAAARRALADALSPAREGAHA
jgi:glycosyltransferase involved in cell wall biosynthesis